MNSIGNMAMPLDFRYRDVFIKGKPQHDRFDKFCIKHPSMDVSRRAKIFAPFSALRGFDDEIASKNIVYQNRIELNDEERSELNHKLHILKGLTFNSRMARKNMVKISVTYFVLCSDKNNESFGLYGQYYILSGTCWNVDEHCGVLTVDNTRIPLKDILNIENTDGIFQKDWTMEV